MYRVQAIPGGGLFHVHSGFNGPVHFFAPPMERNSYDQKKIGREPQIYP